MILARVQAPSSSSSSTCGPSNKIDALLSASARNCCSPAHALNWPAPELNIIRSPAEGPCFSFSVRVRRSMIILVSVVQVVLSHSLGARQLERWRPISFRANGQATHLTRGGAPTEMSPPLRWRSSSERESSLRALRANSKFACHRL